MQAEFETSAANASQCPDPDRPEVAFAGRSNVGKSSLINALTNRRGLARVSRTPGRTRLLNFFTVRLAGPTGNIDMRLVDLPGYGFAKTHRSIRETWGSMIEGYLAKRSVLAALVLLVDVRRGAGELDQALAELATANERPSLIVATKADKLGASQRGLARRSIGEAFGARAADVLLTSASGAMGLHGRDGLASALADVISSNAVPEDTEGEEPQPWS